MTCNAYGAFDFANYTPTLTGLYQNDPTTYIPSAYVLNITTTNPNNSFWTEIPYTTYINGVTNTSSYYYNIGINENRLQEFDLTRMQFYSYDTNPGTIRGQFVSLFAYNGTGGAIYNTGSTCIIDEIIGDFYDNSASSGGGAIYNGGTIISIIGDFVNNNSPHAVNAGQYTSYGGAIYNLRNIGNIQGNFIHNVAYNNGGAIYNNHGTINSITGDFVHNITSNSGGAIYNLGTIGSITGDFIYNTASVEGGAIYNAGEIGTITGDFINNFVSDAGNGGAIYNTGTIQRIMGNFNNNNNNVIYNLGTINITGDIIHNVSTSPTTAIMNDSGELNFVSEIGNYVISDNYQVYNNSANDIAIYATNLATVSFNNNNSTYYTVNDEIAGSDYSLNVGGDGTGYTIFNNNVDNVGVVNINNGKMLFGHTPNNYTGTADYGRFSGTVPTMNLTNGTFDVANGYTETITLNNLVSTGNNNTIRIDLDISNAISDMIISQNTIKGQIKLVVQALADLDLGDGIVWFAQADNDLYRVVSKNTFVLSDIENLSYDLNIVFDSIENKWGLRKDPESTNDPNTPNNPDNPDEPDKPDVPEYPITLSDDLVQMAYHNVHTIRQSVQKMTNSMQKRVGEILWLSSDQQNKQNRRYYNTPSYYKGNHRYGYNRSYYTNYNKHNASELYNAFWTRGVYKNSDIKDTSIGLTGVEFGYDRIISMDNDYKWYLGGIGYASGGTSKFNTISTDLTGYGLGAYTMLITNSGWFADLVFRQHFITIENETDSVAGVGAPYSINHVPNVDNQNGKTDYTASSVNLELGKEFVVNSGKKTKWFIKPSVEGAYVAISGTDIGDYKVKDSTIKMASVSLLIGPRWDYASGDKFQMYGKVAYTLDESDDIDVVINNIDIKQSVAVDTLEVGGGLNYRGNSNALNLYLEASYISGTDYSEISGNAGLRYAF